MAIGQPDWFQLFAPVLPILIAGGLAALAYLYRSERERRVEIEKQLSEHKYETYMLLMETFHEILHGETPAVKDTISRMNELNKKLMIYGSDDVYKAYLEYLTMASYEDENKEIEKLKTEDMEVLREKTEKVIANILHAVRRDMGHAKTKMKAHEIFFLFNIKVSQIGIEEEKIRS